MKHVAHYLNYHTTNQNNMQIRTVSKSYARRRFSNAGRPQKYPWDHLAINEGFQITGSFDFIKTRWAAAKRKENYPLTFNYEMVRADDGNDYVFRIPVDL